MSSVRDIAEQAGVSISTVSRVLNNDPVVNRDTRDRVLSTANRFGYIPTIGRRVTTYLGLAYTGRRTLSAPFDAAVMDGAARGADESRLDLVILNLQRDKLPDETYTQFFLRKGVRGVILRTLSDSREACVAIAREGFPHVVVSERFDAPEVNYIDCDSKADTTRAIEYLISLGHRRIAFAMHNLPDCDHLDRLAGYQEALENHGLPLEDRLVFRHPISLAAGGTVFKLTQSMPDGPTAVFFADPLLAIGAMRKAHEMGVRVPDEVSLVGFDDTDMRYAVYPALTAVCQDASRLGYHAASWLGRALNGSTPKRLQQIVPTFFEINGSSAPPRTNGAADGEHNAREAIRDGRVVSAGESVPSNGDEAANR